MTRILLIALFVIAVITIVHAQTALQMAVTDGVVLCSKVVGDIVFSIDGVERVRICEEGDFLIHGNVFANDKELYAGFKEWLIENKGHIRRLK